MTDFQEYTYNEALESIDHIVNELSMEIYKVREENKSLKSELAKDEAIKKLKDRISLLCQQINGLKAENKLLKTELGLTDADN